MRNKLIHITLNLFTKDIKTRYANSVLGLGWMILNPLLFVSIVSLVFSLVFKSTGYDVPYFLFVLVGYIHWLFFTQTTNLITASLVDNRNIIINVNFPRLAIPLSILMSRLLDFFIFFVITSLLLFFVSGVNVIANIPIYLWLVCVQIFLQFGIGLIASILNVYLRDIQHLIGILLQLLFYVTPVVYNLTIIPERFHGFVRLNPMALILIESRSALFSGVYNINTILIVTAFSLLTLLMGLIVFQKHQKKITEFV